MNRKGDDGTMDLFEGESRRDKGVARVKRNNEKLMVLGLELIRALPKGWTGQIEDVRLWIEKRGHRPTHSNFYGALGREAMKSGLLGRSGRRVKMRRVKSNARKTDELVRL